MVDEQTYVAEFLNEFASSDLVDIFGRAVDRAEAANTQTHLSHVVDTLLDESAVRARVPDEVRAKAKAALAEQVLAISHAGSGEFAFRLAPLVEPARQLAKDWGADRVLPLNFLATCLSAGISLDPVSVRTQEALRSAGLTVETLVPTTGDRDARRQDFTFTSLGFGTDITAMARAGFWATCPLVGLEAQLRTLAKILNSGTGSAVMVGEPGVGKSAFIQGFSYHIAHRDRRFIPRSMDSWTVVMIEAADILQSTSGRGELEGRLREMLVFFRKNPTVIPFFEEVHRLLDTDDSSARTVATALKPPMANGLFRCVGCTTDKEYARFIASDDAMNSRFRKILLPEPDHQTAMQIIEGSKLNLLRGRAQAMGVDLAEDAVRTALRVTSVYQRSDRLPRKAINLLSTVISEKVYELDMANGGSRPSSIITSGDVARLFSEISGIPVDALDEGRPEHYKRLALRLSERVKGQEQAIESVTSWLSLQASGWVDQRRPRGRFLFLGPPGVGKTELAMSIAEEVMRDRGSVIVMSMADYQGEGARNKFMGADPGYIGFGQTPTIYSRVMMRPFSVVVLDEFEKSDPSLSNPLLSIFDGWGVDSQGRAVDFSQCIFVMTSNATASYETVGQSERFGANSGTLRAPAVDGSEPRTTDVDIDQKLRQMLLRRKGIWTPPLLDRIDRVCLFEPLSRETLLEILDGLIMARRMLATRPLPAELTDGPVRLEILEAATSGEDSSSARRLERALMKWLSVRAGSELVESAADLGSGVGRDDLLV
jgi:ATP-dependent Clp protease ATP-binding subunit ClpC